jgi:hypothetical protein
MVFTRNFDRMEEDCGGPIGGALNAGIRDLKYLNVGQQWWHQKAASLVLKPFGYNRNFNAESPMEVIDFGWLLDIHTSFIKVLSCLIFVYVKSKPIIYIMAL